jgi:hypothetical protein
MSTSSPAFTPLKSSDHFASSLKRVSLNIDPAIEQILVKDFGNRNKGYGIHPMNA